MVALTVIAFAGYFFAFMGSSSASPHQHMVDRYTSMSADDLKKVRDERMAKHRETMSKRRGGDVDRREEEVARARDQRRQRRRNKNKRASGDGFTGKATRRDSKDDKADPRPIPSSGVHHNDRDASAGAARRAEGIEAAANSPETANARSTGSRSGKPRPPPPSRGGGAASADDGKGRRPKASAGDGDDGE